MPTLARSSRHLWFPGFITITIFYFQWEFTKCMICCYLNFSNLHLHPRSPLRSEQMDRTFTGREKLLSLGLPVWGPYAKEAGVDGGSVYDANTNN